MVSAIVYVSAAGHTERYARLLAEQTGVPACSLKEAAGSVPKGAPVLLLGWVRAGRIQGLRRAQRHFAVAAACGVGMNPADEQTGQTLRRANPSAPDVLFYLRGGMDPQKLHGLHKLLIGAMAGELQKKADPTPAQREMAALLQNGADFVDPAALLPVREWMAR